ncbi:hypothetical protein [Hymenobacter wooponensis]|uniref:RHS repeat protein n=1 Tax=Hymenobacter wooponensis TaxID=1525360 RepID=A0A4Z0MPM6_9BACT|nr:hypothetical protein [Hymenobacter wooponensis]TGD81298.1 hypothetical protein EU557_06945 [Hymenobacter wooponensis]
MRNKIRSVTKVRLIDKIGEVDSVDYMELDRQGNKVLLYNPHSKARIIRHYDKRGRLVEVIQQPTPTYPYSMREVLDPDKGLYTSFRQPAGKPDVPLLTVTHQRQGNISSSEAQLHQPIYQQGQIITQVTARGYNVSHDTVRVDFFGYDGTQQAQAYQSMYTIVQNGRSIENGTVSFQNQLQALLDSSARARQWRSQGLSDAAILLRQNGLRGSYIASTYSQYDKNGWLIRSEHSSPTKLLSKPVTQESEHGTMTTTSSSYSSFSYQYDAQGRVIREEFMAVFPALSQTSKPASDTVRTVTDKTYSSKGLLLSETNSSAGRTTRYEYRYSRF